jgi:hypothetical protein
MLGTYVLVQKVIFNCYLLVQRKLLNFFSDKLVKALQLGTSAGSNGVLANLALYRGNLLWIRVI